MARPAVVYVLGEYVNYISGWIDFGNEVFSVVMLLKAELNKLVFFVYSKLPNLFS